MRFSSKNTSGDKQPDKQMEAHGYIPVSDETRVDISVLPLILLLGYGHLADRPAQSGQDQTGEQQIAQQTSGALERSRKMLQTPWGLRH